MLLKKIFWFGWRKKKYSDSEFLSYNLMLNSGKKICALHDKKNNILTLVLSRIFFRNHNPPCKLNGLSLTSPCGLISKYLEHRIEGWKNHSNFNVIFKTHLIKQISSFTIGNKNGTARGKIQTRWNVKIPQLFMKIIHLKL
jgi:hypothetical protein